MVKRVAILGSTGSIGRNALRVIEWLNSLGGRSAGRDGVCDRFEPVVLTAHGNVELLAEQARRWRPRYVAVSRADCRGRLSGALEGLDIEVLGGPESLVDLASLDEVDIVLTAVVGVAGLAPALSAARAGKRLAVANKEPLVVAGELLVESAASGRILPVDSEHSAVFQALQAGSAGEVRRIVLTGSGGPFRNASVESISAATPDDVLAHPVWRMGPKVTVDSATMINKAFEVIEAHWLFNLAVEKIDVLIHPESVVHSMVEFVDGSVVAQLGEPDMCLPIQYALTYPGRVEGLAGRLDLERVGRLGFEKPDFDKFRALPLGYEVARAGGTVPAVFNAANEAAVEEFLAGRVRFVSIIRLVEECLNKHDSRSGASLEELLDVDAWARKEVLKLASRL
jgi:1-deoxy-D-xylulose-5-phosphate reductoisomerase